MHKRLEDLFASRFVGRVLRKAGFGACVLLCLGWTLAQVVHDTVAAPAAHGARTRAGAELPAEWDGRRLRPLALSEVEMRFARNFPGTLARMTDGRQVLVLRQVEAPTRMLHPAPDCYRALGYRIAQARIERDAQARLWHCFTAARSVGNPLRVCERIVDADGRAFTDTSSWYWAAVGGQSPGPWQAVTTATLAQPEENTRSQP